MAVTKIANVPEEYSSVLSAILSVIHCKWNQNKKVEASTRIWLNLWLHLMTHRHHVPTQSFFQPRTNLIVSGSPSVDANHAKEEHNRVVDCNV